MLTPKFLLLLRRTLPEFNKQLVSFKFPTFQKNLKQKCTRISCSYKGFYNTFIMPVLSVLKFATAFIMSGQMFTYSLLRRHYINITQ